VEVDRVSEGEEGGRFAVLVYPEGEVPVALGASGRAVGPGDRLRYDPGAARYDPA
jgi:hypothetical protein